MFRVILCMSPLEKVPFATFYPRWKYLCGTYISKKTFSSGPCIQFYRLMQLIFFLHYLKALSAENANHLQTTDTLKRHRRYSIHYHCGWPSLWTWGSATHNGLPALPEPYLRACGLHRVCTRHKKTKQQSRSIMFRVLCIQFYRLTQLIFFQHYLASVKK